MRLIKNFQKLKKLISIILLNLIFTPNYSFAEVVLDNSTGNSLTSDVSPFSQSGTETYGHTFTPSSNMNVSAVSFFIKKTYGGDSNTQAIKAYLYEYDASGRKVSGSALASSNEVNISNNESTTEVEATFTSTVTLTSGVTYLVFYTVIGVSGTQSTNYYAWRRSNVNDSQIGCMWYNNHNTDFTTEGTYACSFLLDFKLSGTLVEESVTDPITDKDVVGSIDSQSQIAKNLISQSTSTVSSRLSYLRQNRGNDNLSKQNIRLDFGNALLTSLTRELLAKNDKSIIPDNWSSWSEGSISVSKIGDRLGSSSSETDGQALAFGFDTKLNDNDLLGFAVQYGQSDTDIGSSGSTTDSENINLSVYRTRPLNDDNFIEGMFGVGLIESDLVRVSGSNTLTGSRNGTQIFGSVNYGKTIDKGDFNLTPIARVDLGYTELDAYSETGTDALSYAKQTIESGLASIGLEFSDIVKFNYNQLKPFGSIEYGMDLSNSSNAKMNYVSDTSTIYTYTQGANSNHLITSVVGFEYITKDNLEIISSYKRIQGNDSEQTDILNVLINFKSKRETEYAMTLDGSEDLAAGFNISKNIDGFDLNFNAKQAFNENGDQEANVSLSRKF